MTDGKRRCDSTCHNATHAKCSCLCEGKFHGAAVLKTKEAERKELEELILKKALASAEDKRALEPTLSPNQPLLFGSLDLATQEDYTPMTAAVREILEPCRVTRPADAVVHLSPVEQEWEETLRTWV